MAHEIPQKKFLKEGRMEEEKESIPRRRANRVSINIVNRVSINIKK